MLSLLKYTLMKICSLWKILPTSNDTIFHYTVFELWAYVSVIARKISWTPESKLVQVMEVFQNNHFLSSDLLINIVYFYPKMQGKFFVQKYKASFFESHFLQFWFFYYCLLPLWYKITRKFVFFFFKYAYLKEHLKKFCYLGTRS